MRAFWIGLVLLAGCRNAKSTDDDSGSLGSGDDAVTDADGDGVPAGEDCDDGDAAVWPGQSETPYDGVDNDCDPSTVDDDLDADGYLSAVDCDDADDAVHPDAEELCNGADDDCDGDVDEDAGDAWYVDADGDGYGDGALPVASCDGQSGLVSNADDCDDTTVQAAPGVTEVCDEIDNNCDGDIDEGVQLTWYVDSDGDGWGVAGDVTEACVLPTGYADQAGDCDDAVAAVNPWATEVCDGVDNDCEGSVDGADALDVRTWYADGDADGYGDGASTVAACDMPSGYVGVDGDCDDSTGAASPAGVEICDTLDNDCNGWTDDADPGVTDASTWYIDFDGDGFGSTGYTRDACSQPSGWVAVSTDCDDTDAAVNPGAAEVCNDADDDCDGDIDGDDSDGPTDSAWYADLDGDGYGDSADTVTDCAAPSSYVADATDCDDTDAGASPGATEVCDLVDNDCDGDVDEALIGGGEDCPAEDCQQILDEGGSSGDGLYWIAPDGDTANPWEAYCDMTTDGGGWTRLYSSHFPTWWSSSDWEDVGVASDDDYSMLLMRDDFADAGVWTLRFEVGNSGTWNTATRAHYTVWTQEHDPFDDTTDGSDYTFIDGEESTTCSGFNGLHDKYYTDHGTYCMSSDVDSGDSVGCWWMQVVPLTQYSSSGYLEGYAGQNTHAWHTLWAR